MQKIIFTMFITIFIAYTVAMAAEVKDTGSIEKISISGNQATVTIKGKAGKFEVIVKDQLTVDKLKDKRIITGDEVRVKYDSDTKESKLFRKTAGC